MRNNWEITVLYYKYSKIYWNKLYSYLYIYHTDEVNVCNNPIRPQDT